MLLREPSRAHRPQLVRATIGFCFQRPLAIRRRPNAIFFRPNSSPSEPNPLPSGPNPLAPERPLDTHSWRSLGIYGRPSAESKLEPNMEPSGGLGSSQMARRVGRNWRSFARVMHGESSPSESLAVLFQRNMRLAAFPSGGNLMPSSVARHSQRRPNVCRPNETPRDSKQSPPRTSIAHWAQLDKQSRQTCRPKRMAAKFTTGKLLASSLPVVETVVFSRKSSRSDGKKHAPTKCARGPLMARQLRAGVQERAHLGCFLHCLSESRESASSTRQNTQAQSHPQPPNEGLKFLLSSLATEELHHCGRTC